MGCASSTPMITTAGSEILKAATHVADDATKGAESALQDLGKTVDTAKEAVGTTVAGLGNELSDALKEKTDALDAAKTQLMEKLHLSGPTVSSEPQHTQPETDVSPPDAMMHVHNEFDAVNDDGNVDAGQQAEDEMIEERSSRAPTPADSLKTTISEPEIVEALANAHEDSPPTPKPTLSELEELTASHVDGQTKRTAVDRYVYSKLSEEKRPPTTEWEKFADSLALTRKYNPYEALRRGGTIGNFRKFVPPPQLQHATSAAAATTSLASGHALPTSVYTPKANNRVRPEDDSLASDPYYNSCSSSQFESEHVSSAGSMRRGGLVLRPVAVQNGRRAMQREGTNVTVASLARSNSSLLALTTPQKRVAPARKFDYNPARSRIGGSLATSPAHSVSVSRTVPKLQPTANVAPRRKSMASSGTPAQSRQNSMLSMEKFVLKSPIKNGPAITAVTGMRPKVLRNTKLPKTPKTPPTARQRLRRPASPVKTASAIKRTLQVSTLPAARTHSSGDLKTFNHGTGALTLKRHPRQPITATTTSRKTDRRSSIAKTVEEPPVQLPLQMTAKVIQPQTPTALARRQSPANVSKPLSSPNSAQHTPAKSTNDVPPNKGLHSNAPLPRHEATKRLGSTSTNKSCDSISVSSLSSDDSCLVICVNYTTPSPTDSPERTTRTHQLVLDHNDTDDDDAGHEEGNIKLPLPYSFETGYNKYVSPCGESTEATTTPTPSATASPSHAIGHHIEQERCVVCYNQYVIK